MSVLRYDYYGTTGTTLTATHEWNLTADLPAAAANDGLEGITWIPDSYLRRRTGFFDEAANAVYDPERYPDHGTGCSSSGTKVRDDLRLRARSRRGNVHARRDGGQRA